MKSNIPAIRTLSQLILLSLISMIILMSCAENDDVPPVITMSGSDTVDHVLNEIYYDAGATALDETDGSLTSNIYVDNQLNIDLIGEYAVVYSVVDKSGNEATPVSRTVFVYNTSEVYTGNYDAEEVEVPPGQGVCSYPTYVREDSVVNNSIVFLKFGCDSGLEVYANIQDSLLVLPYQLYLDSLVNISFQGSGFINDSIIFLEYTKKDSGITSFWNATLYRVQ